MTRYEQTPDRPTSRWSLRLGRLWGIEVHVHATLLLLLGLVATWQGTASGSWATAATILAGAFVLFGCVLLHEYGHALAARRYGIHTKRISLLPIGGVAELDRMPDEPRQELVVAIAGPLVNAALALLAGVTLGTLALAEVELGAPWASAAGFFVAINLLMMAFNLIPALPMDGGRVLRALLAMRMSPVRATVVAANVGRALALLMGIVGLFVNPFLAVIAVFVWVTAGREAGYARLRAGMNGASVRSAMSTDFRTIGPFDDLEAARAAAIRSGQDVLPVTGPDGRLVGLLGKEDLVAGRAGERVLVADRMRSEFPYTAPGDELEPVFRTLFSGAIEGLPVLEGTRIVGLVTRDNLRRFLRFGSSDAAPMPA